MIIGSSLPTKAGQQSSSASTANNASQANTSQAKQPGIKIFSLVKKVQSSKNSL